MLKPKAAQELTEIAFHATRCKTNLQKDISLLRWTKSSLNRCARSHKRHLMSTAKTIHLHVFDKVENSPFAGGWRKMIFTPPAIACSLHAQASPSPHDMWYVAFFSNKSLGCVSPLVHRFHSIRQTLDNLRIHGWSGCCNHAWLPMRLFLYMERFQNIRTPKILIVEMSKTRLTLITTPLGGVPHVPWARIPDHSRRHPVMTGEQSLHCGFVFCRPAFNCGWFGHGSNGRMRATVKMFTKVCFGSCGNYNRSYNYVTEVTKRMSFQVTMKLCS